MTRNASLEERKVRALEKIAEQLGKVGAELSTLQYRPPAPSDAAEPAVRPMRTVAKNLTSVAEPASRFMPKADPDDDEIEPMGDEDESRTVTLGRPSQMTTE